jgi:uroporphyrinogen decarboxylase
LIARLGLDDEEELRRYLNTDMRRVGGYGIGRQEADGPDERGYFRNMWGVLSRPADEDGHGTETVYPFDDDSTVDDVHSHDWPDPSAVEFNVEKEQCEAYAEEFAVFGSPWGPFFHEAWWTVGQENFYVWMYTKPDVLQAVIDHIVDYEVEVTRRFLEAMDGMIDFTYFGNDFGAQRGLLLSPRMFEQFLRAPVKRYYDVSHEMGCRVMQHSCGSIRQIIPMLIDDGVDVIDPVQTYAAGMALGGLVSDFGQHVSFHGGVDTQTVLPFGTIEDVRGQVRSYVELTRDSGGYVLASSQEFMEDVPLDNILAMYDENARQRS